MSTTMGYSKNANLSLPAPCSFELEHYEFILRRALDLGYNFFTHLQYVKHCSVQEPFILLRHDIDFSLKRALQLVRLEHSLGIVSTIFVRIHASGYNLFDLYNYAILRQFRSWGCEIALHHEPLFAQLTREEPLRLLHRAKRVLESVLDEPVHGLVSHTPRLAPYVPDFTVQDLAQCGFCYEAVEPRFTQENLYLSDANRRWRRGCLCRHLGQQRRITVLVHPYWWYPMTDSEKYEAIQHLRQGT